MADLIKVTDEEAKAAYEKGCPQCLSMGSSWVHLRMCLVCGQVGCCDNFPNKHATAHFKETGHAVMRSIEPDESWKWDFVQEKGWQ
jgi:uncharacterized UBP type Zn finger protein